MSLKTSNPGTIAAPQARYSHSVEVPPNARWLYVSGQVGVDKDGNLPSDIESQSENCWRNVEAILKDAGMGFDDVVRVNSYITDSRFVGGWRAGRDKVLTGDHVPASTLVVVSGLAAPEMLVEVEVVAAKAD